jgi:membrane-associated protein
MWPLFALALFDSVVYDNLFRYGGFGLIVLATFLETGALIGILAPGGETLLFTSGLLCGLGTLTVPVEIMIPVLIAASVAGDFTGFHIGRRIGDNLLERKSTLFFSKKQLDKARSFYKRNGQKAFILGRFIPFVRTFNPFIAGASGVRVRSFISLAAIGCIMLVTFFVLAGYFVARQFPEAKEHVGWLIGGIIAFASIPVIITLIRERRYRKKNGQRDLKE